MESSPSYLGFLDEVLARSVPPYAIIRALRNFKRDVKDPQLPTELPKEVFNPALLEPVPKQ